MLAWTPITLFEIKLIRRGTRVIDFFSFQVFDVGRFWVVEISKKFIFSICPDASLPFASAFYPAYPQVAALCAAMWFCLVLHIFVRSYLAEIVNSIVVTNPVNVVNYGIWPFSIDKKPRKTMSKVSLPKNFYLNVPVGIASSGCLIWLDTIAGADFPSKQPRIRVVVEQLFKLFRINFVHAVAPLCNGLKSDGSMLTHRAVAPF
jgi:hypothetical protein